MDGEFKRCIWCGDPLKSRHPSTRYCKDKECMFSVMAWANPQKSEGLLCLMVKQDWKCAGCSHDYKQHLTPPEKKLGIRFVGKLKRGLPKALAPEVDHIVPIAKGGQALGISNHQVLCYQCHKAKTKTDNSGPRKPRS